MATNRHTYIHTTSANAVTLVWGSLRLAPITYVCMVTKNAMNKLLDTVHFIIYVSMATKTCDDKLDESEWEHTYL